MKKRVLSLFSILTLLIVLLIPSTAFAASQKHIVINTNTYLSISDSNLKHSYYVGPSTIYPVSGSNGFYRTFFHQITDGNNIYLAYCLDPRNSTFNDSGTISTNALANLSAANFAILKNIIAAGQQLGNYTNVDTFVKKTDAQSKMSYLATQILVWEVMGGARTNYSSGSKALNTPANHSSTYDTYDLVSQNSTLKTIYENILKKAYQLTDEGKPSGLKSSKPYVLKWNDSKNKYISSAINIGEYDFSMGLFPSSVTLSNKDKNNNITITSTKEVTKPIEATFEIVHGVTTNAGFKWFNFSNHPNGQRMALAYYKGSNTANLSFKTEKGIFKIDKYDLSTKKSLKGAKFDMYKCKSQTSGCTKVSTIDMTNKTISSDITITKSGLYKFVETQVPVGHEKIRDFFLTLKIQDDEYTYQGNTYSNVKILVNESDKDFINVSNANKGKKYAHLLLYNEAKSFTISKIDGNDNKTKIKGATFNIKDSKGNVVKFNKLSEGNYEYNASGTITDLVSANLSEYTISALPVGEYILEETNVTSGYILPSKQTDRQTRFKIDAKDFLQTLNSSGKYVKSSNETIIVKNYKTKVRVNKTGTGGVVLPGIVFELYDSKKENRISVVNSGGQYYYNGTLTSSAIITDSKGNIVINSLPEGTYYLKEVDTGNTGYTIDENNQWTKIVVTINSNSNNIQVSITNAKGQFCFYKIDEDGNYLADGKFKLQIYNETNSKFEDVALIQNTDKTFKIDSTKKSNIYTFTPVSESQTCFVELDSKTRYKIVEIEAPEGFVLPTNPSDKQVEVSINEHGYANGNAVIINKKINIGDGTQARAELIVGISTGMEKINYVLIIGGIGLIIGVLIFIKKKMDK